MESDIALIGLHLVVSFKLNSQELDASILGVPMPLSRTPMPSANEGTNQDEHQLSPPVDDDNQTYKQSKKKLNEAIKGSSDVLVSANTSLTLLRDTIALDRAKLTVIRRRFVGTAEVMSIRIEDILNVTTTLGPLYANLVITSRVINSGPFTIGKFKRRDAVKIKHVTQGYVIALQREIDCGNIPTKELIDMLNKLGKDEHDV